MSDPTDKSDAIRNSSDLTQPISIGEQRHMQSGSMVLFVAVIGCAFSQPSSGAQVVKFHEKVLWSFGIGTDGTFPQAALINVKDVLYGTTLGGGAHGEGVVFALDLHTGTERVLYFFCSLQSCADGESPEAGLIYKNGILYGTTVEGGDTDCGGAGCGTLFSLDPKTDIESVLYTGGDGGCVSFDCGNVFSVNADTDGENVLYDFCSEPTCADGVSPYAGLIAVNRILYGTTEDRGANGYGTVFAIMKDH